MPRSNVAGTDWSASADIEAAYSSSHASRREPSIQMPRRNPISPTVAPTYADSRAPAASTSSTSPAGAASPQATNTIAPTYAPPKIAQANVCQTAELQRTASSGAYQRSQTARRAAIIPSLMPATRSSLPGAGVVASANRCRASRFDCAVRSRTCRSTPGRQLEVTTVGSANAAISTSAGWIDTSSITVTASRKIQPQVLNTDIYMWS